jgi:hypothetical protein
MNRIIESLLLIRLGQELGTDSPLARAVAEMLVLAVKWTP